MKDTRRNFLRLLDDTWPGLRSAFIAAARQVQNNIAIKALEDAIARQDLQAAFDALRMDQASLYALDEAIEGAFRAGGKYQVESVVAATSRFPQGARIVQSFGGRNDRAERIARELGSRLVTEVIDDTRTLIAQAVAKGLELGRGPNQTALDIAGRVVGRQRTGGLVGLHSRQVNWVQNYRARLVTEDRPADQVERMAGRYANKLLRQRGETIARTETIKALNAGRQEGLDQLVDSGRLDADQIDRIWDSTADSRTRPTHAAADGQSAGSDGVFTVGGYQMRYPGDTSLGAPAGEVVNCRCYMAPKIDYFKGLD